jgi:RNA polymerase sigma factor (sigma-70 family)
MSVDLDTVVRDLAPRLLRYAIGRTDDRGLGEEVAQDALAALVQRWRRLGPPESPEAFAFAIARRRAQRSVVRRRLLVPLLQLQNRADSIPNPEDQAVSAAERRSVRAALRHLPRLDRDALLLVAAGELRTIDAARVLGISESALKMLSFRGRRRLAALLGSGDGSGR